MLGRGYENQGVLDHWTNVINGQGPKAAVKGFFTSDEFKGKNLSPEDTIRKLYAAIYQRLPSGAGDDAAIAICAAQLRQGVPITAIIDNFYVTPEYQQRHATGELP